MGTSFNLNKSGTFIAQIKKRISFSNDTEKLFFFLQFLPLKKKKSD